MFKGLQSPKVFFEVSEKSVSWFSVVFWCLQLATRNWLRQLKQVNLTVVFNAFYPSTKFFQPPHQPQPKRTSCYPNCQITGPFAWKLKLCRDVIWVNGVLYNRHNVCISRVITLCVYVNVDIGYAHKTSQNIIKP